MGEEEGGEEGVQGDRYELVQTEWSTPSVVHCSRQHRVLLPLEDDVVLRIAIDVLPPESKWPPDSPFGRARINVLGRPSKWAAPN